MTKNELLYIKCITEEQSLSRAAQKLGLTQPTLSKCLLKIETGLGTKLFSRSNAGLALTFAGKRYFKMAGDILRIYNDFEIEISDINNLKKGSITVGCTNYLATYILPLVLPDFKSRCPNIDVSLVEENSTELESSLLNGEIDFAIMHNASFRGALAERTDLVFHPLFDDPFVLVTKADHPLGRFATKVKNSAFPRIDLTRFASEPFIMVKRGQRIRQVAEIILQRAGIDPPVALTTKSYETARRLATAGIGVTFVPLQYLALFTDVYAPTCYSVDERYAPYWTLCIGLPRKAYLSKAAKLFITMVCEKTGAAAPEF